ncbi:MAG: 50S ribosomal protein L24 [Chloroflexi bacterium RBG_13_53_26]|nr:MAG: 50S ribosomal protein L24 [Chloroflexi bacterium RBG_13_53_26]
MKIRKNDNVLVVTGKDKGKKGKVRYAYPDEERLIVDGINMVKRHTKARAMARQAGVIEREAPLRVSKVMLICSKCNRPTRVGFRFVEENKVRVCSSCREVID